MILFSRKSFMLQAVCSLGFSEELGFFERACVWILAVVAKCICGCCGGLVCACMFACELLLWKDSCCKEIHL
jgi:hypothetical protein